MTYILTDGACAGGRLQTDFMPEEIKSMYLPPIRSVLELHKPIKTLIETYKPVGEIMNWPEGEVMYAKLHSSEWQ